MPFRVDDNGIGEMKPVPESEVPLLLELAADMDANVRGTCLASLGHAGAARPEVVEALIKALDDPETRGSAAAALGELGPSASAALGKLTAQLSAVRPQERVSVAKSIWQIDAASPAVFPALIEVLKDTKTIRAGQVWQTRKVDGKIVTAWSPFTEPVSCRAAEVLCEMGPAAAPAVQPLIETANSDHREAALSAIRALHAMEPAADPAVLALNRLTRSEDHFVAQAAREAVCAIEGKPAPIPTGTIFAKQD
jgi:HEAT repeat protein